MNEHLQDLKSGGRPMTKLELANKEIERLNNIINGLDNTIENLEEVVEHKDNIINRTTKYVQSLSSKGRGCDIYEDIKQEILKELKDSDKE